MKLSKFHSSIFLKEKDQEVMPETLDQLVRMEKTVKTVKKDQWDLKVTQAQMETGDQEEREVKKDLREKLDPLV